MPGSTPPLVGHQLSHSPLRSVAPIPHIWCWHRRSLNNWATRKTKELKPCWGAAGVPFHFQKTLCTNRVSEKRFSKKPKNHHSKLSSKNINLKNLLNIWCVWVCAIISVWQTCYFWKVVNSELLGCPNLPEQWNSGRSCDKKRWNTPIPRAEHILFGGKGGHFQVLC